jgi:hypothetical protein
MATQMLSLSQPFGNRSADLCILARRAAIKAVKAQLQARGVRLSYISARETKRCSRSKVRRYNAAKSTVRAPNLPR